MIGILGGMGTQAGLDFCNKLAKLNKGKDGSTVSAICIIQ